MRAHAICGRGHETGVARRAPFEGGLRTTTATRALPAVSCPRKSASFAASCPRNILAATLVALCLASVADGAVHFRTVDLVITSDAPLAAWQVDVRYDRARAKIVGLEGGEAGEGEAWREPPHYDTRGMSRGRIVIAAFVDDDAKATTGRARVARLHIQVELPNGGDAEAAIESITVRLVAAAQVGGERIAPKIELVNAKVVVPEVVAPEPVF